MLLIQEVQEPRRDESSGLIDVTDSSFSLNLYEPSDKLAFEELILGRPTRVFMSQFLSLHYVGASSPFFEVGASSPFFEVGASSPFFEVGASSPFFQGLFVQVSPMMHQVPKKRQLMHKHAVFQEIVLDKPDEFYFKPIEFEPVHMQFFRQGLATFEPPHREAIISKETHLDKILDAIGRKFKIINSNELKEFLLLRSVDFHAGFSDRLEKTCLFIEDFLTKQAIESSKQISVYNDHEIADLQAISIMIYANNVTTERCISMMKQVITDIAHQDREMLKYLSIQIIPELA